MRNFFKNIKAKIIRAAVLMQEKRGENFVDSGIKILIAVVIGAAATACGSEEIHEN